MYQEPLRWKEAGLQPWPYSLDPAECAIREKYGCSKADYDKLFLPSSYYAGLCSVTDAAGNTSLSDKGTGYVLEKFALLPDLPFELRKMIFEACVTPRIVMMDGSSTTMSFGTAVPEPINPSSVPVLFHINKESREVAKRKYQCFGGKWKAAGPLYFDRGKRSQKTHMDPPFYFNPATDIFFCFTRTAGSLELINKERQTEPASCFTHDSLRQIPLCVRSHIRYMVVLDRVHYLAGVSYASTVVSAPDERKKHLLYTLLSKEFGALEQIMVIASIDVQNPYSAQPLLEQLSEMSYSKGTAGLVEEVKKEHPKWKGPAIFIGKMTLK